MKKLTYFFLAVGIVLLAACTATVTVKPSEKAAGTYTGPFTFSGDTNTYTGTTAVSANGDNAVNMNMTCPPYPAIAVTSVNVTLSGDIVTFAYSSTSTTDGTVIAVNGTVTISTKTLNYGATLYFLAGNQTVGFSGTKP